MPSLRIRELPDAVYRKLRELAKKEHRTLAQQATVLLAQALEAGPSERERRLALLARLAQQPPVPGIETMPPPEALIREDRER
jgi:plasmid stability protein